MKKTFDASRPSTGPASWPSKGPSAWKGAVAAGGRARVTRVGGVLTLLLVGWAVRAGAAAVSPMAVYLDDRARTSSITLFNPGELAEEIEIGFAFGYPTSDAEGNVGVALVEEPGADEPNAVPWLRAFPRRLVLEPGQRQVVRIMVQPPAGLDDGEYWGRALIRSRGGQPPIEELRGDVAVQVNVETVVVAAVSYRHGRVDTGLEVVAAGARRDGGRVVGLIDLARMGNAAFLGRIVAEVIDGEGMVLGATEDVLAVYRTIRRRVEVPVPAGAEGPLRLRYRLDTDRDDLPAGGPLPAEPVVHTVPVA